MDQSNVFRTLVLTNIKQLRKSRGVTQEQMAELLSMTKQNYFRIESGRQSLRVEHLPILAEALNSNMEAFFSADEIHPRLGQSEQLLLSYLRRMEKKSINPVIALIREIQARQLSDEQLSILLSLVREFK